MTNSQNDENLMKDKDARIAHLEKACQWNLFFLDLLASQGDFLGNDFLNKDVNAIFNLTRMHLKRFVDFHAIAFFIVDETDFDFVIENCDPQSEQKIVLETVDYLVEDGTFAWALNQNRPVVVKANHFGHALILHVLSTKMRVWGMFVGVIGDKDSNVTDAQLYPLSIALHYTASALESTSLCRMLSDHNENLQNTVQKRTKELENQAAKLKQMIDEQKQTEKELKKYHDHLEELVEERTNELKSVQDQLVHAEKLSAIGKLSASIAHEFNNPITGIHNVLERISKKVSMNETNKDLVDVAIRECERITNLIKKLQDFHRPSPGIVAPVDIHEAINEVILLNKGALKKRRIKVETSYADNMPKIQAISDQIKQVILNILKNAGEAIPEDGGGGEIKILTEVFGSRIKVHFQDSGRGVSPENIKYIFDPFFSTKTSTKGTGLGLSVSYGIIKQHAGEVEVKSEPGKGTTFTITLPIKKNKAVSG